MSEQANLTETSEADLWNELERRGIVLKVGYCYPAACSDEAATELVHEHGYEYGPFQLIELNHRLASEPHWSMYARIPPKYRRVSVSAAGPLTEGDAEPR